MSDNQQTNEAEASKIAQGWERYAQKWTASAYRVLPGHEVAHLGDEWSGEPADRTINYGLPAEITRRFGAYLDERLLAPHLPNGATTGLEIGPGGGRLTTLLSSYCRRLHLAEPSAAMIAHLRARFGEDPRLVYHHTDGSRLPELSEALDFVFAFDVFVHFEPRLIFSYK